MAEDYILKQAILKLFVTLNGEFYLGEHLLWKLYHCACETSASPKPHVKILNP